MLDTLLFNLHYSLYLKQKGGTTSDHEQISALVKHLTTLSNRKYQGFINALVQTGQSHVATLILGEKLPQVSCI